MALIDCLPGVGTTREIQDGHPFGGPLQVCIKLAGAFKFAHSTQRFLAMHFTATMVAGIIFAQHCCAISHALRTALQP